LVVVVDVLNTQFYMLHSQSKQNKK
jgi:hypothetical protein